MTRAALESICQQIGEAASERQIEALFQFLQLLQHWNTVYNLTSIRDPAQMLSHHLADCLAAVARVGQAPLRCLDVGSGGGLPGAIMAIMRPAIAVTCVDAVGKKVAFVRQVAGTLRLANLTAIHRRVEMATADRYQLVTSRAFASLSDFTRLTDSWLGEDGVWLALKGRSPDDEISQLPLTIEVFHVEQLEVPTLAAERCLVWMRRKVRYSLSE